MADGVEITHGRPSYEVAGASIQPPAREIRKMKTRRHWIVVCPDHARHGRFSRSRRRVRDGAIDASTANCFDTPKARLIKRLWSGGYFVRGGKRYFAVVKVDASPKLDRKSPSSRSKKTNGVERKPVRRPKVFKSDDWYEKAARSMTISAKL